MNTTPQPTPQEKAYVMHIGSYDTKYGSADFDTPKSVPTCVAFPIATRSYKESFHVPQKNKDKQTKQTAREKQLLRMRGQLLADRGTIDKEAIEKETYFEQIPIIEKIDIGNQNGFHKILNSPTKHRNIPMHNLLSNAAVKEFIPPILSEILIGQEALDACQEEDHPSSSVEHELFFPIWKGRLNVNRADMTSIQKVLDSLEALWSNIFFQLLDLTVQDVETSNLILIIPDQMVDQSAGIELKFILEILLTRMKFSKIFVQRESICAAFGAGTASTCVVDMGESKTSVSIVDDGELICKSDFNCGGYHLLQTLLWTMYQSKLPIDGLSTDIHLNDRESLRTVMETNLHAEQKNEEIFKTIEFKHLREGRIYKMEVGDPLYITTLSYFNPKILGKNKQNGPMGIISNEFINDNEMEDYTSAEKDFFFSRNNMKELKSVKTVIDTSETDLNSSNVQQTSGKRKRTSTSSKKENKEDVIVPPVKKAKVVPSLERVIVKMLKKSGVEFSKSKDKDAKKQKINILLIGGCSQIKEFGNLLKLKLEEHITGKLKCNNCLVNVQTNDRDKGTNVRFMSWTGGCIINQLESIKDMWVSRQDFESNGMKSVLERLPL